MKREDLSLFKGRRVFLTGDTGFKGAWLSLWLHDLGAHVHGYALPPEKKGDLFRLLRLDRLIQHEDGDIRDLAKLKASITRARPEFLFHLAAQALVRRSHEKPALTFETNVTGSANVLEAARECPSLRSLVYVTSDKCYRNKGLARGYREDDELGGSDPYSASKAFAELILTSYQDAYFKKNRRLGTASARAGNVIGGGDWADDRIVPDIVASLQRGRPVTLRNPKAVRPWQHVLDPLAGYLSLAAGLRRAPARYAGAWNFGPEASQSRTVLDLTHALARRWGKPLKVTIKPSRIPEAHVLRLDAAKSRRQLGWTPRWDFAAAVEKTSDWYRAADAGEDARELTRRQIREYLV